MHRYYASMALVPFFMIACSAEEREGTESETVSLMGSSNMVVFSTTMGDITIELFPEEAPTTVENFLSYVDEGFYDGTVVHRVVPGFVIQGGGFTPEMTKKETRAPITNEADNGLKNVRGSLSMARLPDVNSATSQFFINLQDNASLDHGVQGFGYAVFARVVDGLDVIDAIAAVNTGTQGRMQNVPVEPVVITSARRAPAG